MAAIGGEQLLFPNHSLCACMLSRSVVSDSLQAYQGSSVHWNFPGKNTGVGCYFLLQGIFLTQGSNPHFLWLWHCRWILYH